MKHTYLFNLLLAIALATALIALFVGGPYLVTAQGPGGDLSAQATLGPAFTYQGFLTQNGTAVDGQDQCDMEFGLWDAATSGSQVGITQTVTTVDFNSGYFTVELNGGAEFGANAFSGEARWLAISVRCPAGSGSYTSLGRQALTAAPYAHYSLSTQALQGHVVTSTAPISGQVLKYDGSQWGPGTDETGAGGLDPANIIIVAKSGGDFTSVQAALNSISDASVSNPYLVMVAPGVYTEQVTMKQYVDIEGSGEGVTKITSTGGSSLDSSSATLIGANNAELRFLTVENTGGSNIAIGIYNNSAAPRLTHVTATASGGSANFGVYNTSSSPPMNDVTVSASGGSGSYGVYNTFSSPPMNDVTVSASGGSSNFGVYNSGSSPPMNDVTVSASGGSSQNRGMANFASSPTMNDVTVSASGGGESWGVSNSNLSSLTMNDVTVTASGGSSTNYGVLNTDGSSLTMNDVTVSASGGSTNRGVHNESSSSTIHHSVISGTTSIYNQFSSTANIGASQLLGPISGSGFSCVGVYTSTFTAFTDASCN